MLFLPAIWLKMAQKRYTFERLNGVAADSAAKWRSTLQVKDLTCEYVQQDVDVAIKGSDKLKFLWKSHHLATAINSKSKQGVAMWLSEAYLSQTDGIQLRRLCLYIVKFERVSTMSQSLGCLMSNVILLAKRKR